MGEAWAAERVVARFAIAAALGVMGAGLAWFGWIDAPIFDRVMLWIVAATAAGSLVVLAALWAMALTLAGAPADAPAAQRRVRRWLRLALAALALLVLLMALASIVTLNVRGENTGSDTEDTAVAV